MFIGTTLVLVAAGAWLDALIRRALWAEFDEALTTKASSLAMLVEQTDEGLEFEVSPTEPAPAAAPVRDVAPTEYYQLWGDDGACIARSPSLGEANLDRPRSVMDAALLVHGPLPDGGPGLIIAMTFTPRRDDELPDTMPSVTVSLVVARSVAALDSTLARLRGVLALVGVVTVVLLGVVENGVIRRGFAPVMHVSSRIARISPNDLTARVDPTGTPRELAPIIERLNELLSRLEAAFQRERRFSGDVAHELRTPLAALRATLELALSRPRSPEAHEQSLTASLSVALQMQRMVENLLHLVRAEARQLDVRRQFVGVDDLVRQCWAPLAARAAKRRLHVDWQLGESGAIETDRDLLELVIQNLLDNAVGYTNEDGRIIVTTARDGAMHMMEVANTGCAISASSADRVFERFWRGDATCPSAEGHSGLGLALCKTVVEQLGGSISARIDDTGLFAMTLRLPC